MTTTTRSRDIFDFFGLARELREMIYNDPLTDKEIGDLSGDALGIFFTATHIPRTNLLLVSQQFSAEYQAASNELATLIVGDKMCEVYDEPVQMNLPDQLRSTHKLRLNLYVCALAGVHGNRTAAVPCTECTCMLGRELALHMSWTSSVKRQMPQLEFVEVTLHVQTRCLGVVGEETGSLERHAARLAPLLVGIDAADFGIWSVSCDPTIEGYDSVDHHQVMEWDPATQRFEVKKSGAAPP